MMVDFDDTRFDETDVDSGTVTGAVAAVMVNRGAQPLVAVPLSGHWAGGEQVRQQEPEFLRSGNEKNSSDARLASHRTRSMKRISYLASSHP